jgi:23S rRNA (adenine1618-N6)-methyltransferase
MKEKAEFISLHPRNKHLGSYPLEELAETLPKLREFLFINPFGNLTLDFGNPLAVKCLNQALLKHYYHIDWDIPSGFLCPPVPGRADYIHHLADLMDQKHEGDKETIGLRKVLDIGTGANLIYPILGASCYGWDVIGSEINPKAISSATKIILDNPHLVNKIQLRHQYHSDKVFFGITERDEFFDATLCNPPFHDSAEMAQQSNLKKVRGLEKNTVPNAQPNFGGQDLELWTAGGEIEFIRKMIVESREFRKQVFWFSTLVSKSEHLKFILKLLKNMGVFTHKIVPMAQGNKISRFIAWTFLNEKQQDSWKKFRWI